MAYQLKKVKLQQKIQVRINGEIIETSLGRIIFNQALPVQMRFINTPIKGLTIRDIILRATEIMEKEDVIKLIDKIKTTGFWAVTLAGISISIFDAKVVPDKQDYLDRAEKEITEIEGNMAKGLITPQEKSQLSQMVWIKTTEELANATWEHLGTLNPIRMMVEAGARGSRDQAKQLSAMRGLSTDPTGKIVELPTKSNFREGLSIFEYVTSTRGSRKGLTDSALKTADAGYLTRRLVDVSHDAIIRLEDCKTIEGIEISKQDKRQASFAARVLGRILAESVVKGKKTIFAAGIEITPEVIKLLDQEGLDIIVVRSPLTCKAKYGLCGQCYGKDFSTRTMVEIGVPVGIVAAQSIGEPGTQLTMRVKHAGGIVGLDVTQGLPRVEELFEARTPKILSPLSEIAGKVEIVDKEDGRVIRVKTIGIKPVEEREYQVPVTSELLIKEGDLVSVGQQLVSGFLDVKEVLQVRGLRGSQRYLIDEVQRVYESQGIPINDKHFEVIVRKMSDKVRIETSGDTILLPGELVDKLVFEDENARVLAEGGEPATATVIILGITRAALYTESWLSAASFQETTNILTEAAISGKEDKLMGLKENVIIGKLIPVSEDRARLE